MNFTRFLSWSALSGAVVSMLFRAIWGWINGHTVLNLTAKIVLQKITLIVWPGSLIMSAATADEDMAIKLFVIAMLSNVLLYMLVGTLAWLGIKRHVGFFAPLALGLGTLWWGLLTL